MKLRFFLTALFFLAAGIAIGDRVLPLFPEGTPLATATAPDASDPKVAATWYTCGMHPEVVQDHPGNCPKCGMKLQPMARDRAISLGLVAPDEVPAGEREIAYWRSPMVPGETHTEPGVDSMGHDLVPVYADEAGAGTIRIDPVTEQNMGVRVAEVASGPVRRTIRTVGFIDYDESTLANVTTKVDGWIEKLYVDQTGTQIHTGDPLFELYAPELVSAQQEYLAAHRSRRAQPSTTPLGAGALSDDNLLRDARTRLEYFDISTAQIRDLERTGRVRKTLTIRSPYTGIVVRKNVVSGRMVNAGDELFRVADVSTVWVIGKIFENDLPYVDVGQEALMSLSYIPGKTFRGHVTYVYPYLDEKSREAAVRMEFHNPGYELKPGMYTTVTLSGEVAEQATLVPDIAVIRTGLRDVAFVTDGPGRYRLRELRLGVRADDDYLQVLSGLTPGETVVTSGQFLLDSESRLREAALKFTEPKGRTEPESPPPAPPSASASAGEAGRQYWVCPMPEHVDVLYDEPGKCPLCGMNLVPVQPQADEQQMPAPSTGDGGADRVPVAATEHRHDRTH